MLFYGLLFMLFYGLLFMLFYGILFVALMFSIKKGCILLNCMPEAQINICLLFHGAYQVLVRALMIHWLMRLIFPVSTNTLSGFMWSRFPLELLFQVCFAGFWFWKIFAWLTFTPVLKPLKAGLIFSLRKSLYCCKVDDVSRGNREGGFALSWDGCCVPGAQKSCFTHLNCKAASTMQYNLSDL